MFYPLITADESYHITHYIKYTGTDTFGVRYSPVGSSDDRYDKMFKYGTTDGLQGVTAPDRAADLTMYYDWSEYNAEGSWKIHITYVWEGIGEDATTHVDMQTYYLGTNSGTASDPVQVLPEGDAASYPKPEDFKFGFRNLGGLDSATVGTVDEAAGQVLKTGMYYDRDDAANANNGALTFKVQNALLDGDGEGTDVTVLDFQCVFLRQRRKAHPGELYWNGDQYQCQGCLYSGLCCRGFHQCGCA